MSNTITISTDDLRLTHWDIDESVAEDRDAVMSPLHTLFFGVTPSGDELLLRVEGRRAGRMTATLHLETNWGCTVRLRLCDETILEHRYAAVILQLIAWRAFCGARARLLTRR